MPRMIAAPFIKEAHDIHYDPVFKKTPQGEMIVTQKTGMSTVKCSK